MGAPEQASKLSHFQANLSARKVLPAFGPVSSGPLSIVLHAILTPVTSRASYAAYAYPA